MMSYLPNSRNSSAMTRSLSTPNLNDNNKENSNKNKKNKSSFKGGLKSWWNKISGRFQNVKNRENTNKFSHSVSINIIPDDDDDEEENIQEINARCTAGNGNDSLICCIVSFVHINFYCCCGISGTDCNNFSIGLITTTVVIVISYGWQNISPISKV